MEERTGHIESPEVRPDVSVVMVNYNTREMTLAAIEALKRSVRDPDFTMEIVLVDNASSDGSVEAIRERFPDVRLVPSEVNLGFGVGNNHGAAVARGKALFMLNSDTEAEPGAVETLFEYLNRDPKRGVAGAYLEYPDGTRQPSILRFPTVWRIFCVFFWLDRIPHRFFSGMFDLGADPAQEGEIEVAHGAAMMVRRNVFEEVGGFDPDFFMYFEECDLCRRIAERGYTVGYTPKSRIVHFEGASSRERPWWFFRVLRESRMIYARKHFGPLGRLAVVVIVHLGYGLRLVTFGLLGLFNKRLRAQGRNMLLSYVKRSG